MTVKGAYMREHEIYFLQRQIDSAWETLATTSEPDDLHAPLNELIATREPTGVRIVVGDFDGAAGEWRYEQVFFLDQGSFAYTAAALAMPAVAATQGNRCRAAPADADENFDLDFAELKRRLEAATDSDNNWAAEAPADDSAPRRGDLRYVTPRRPRRDGGRFRRRRPKPFWPPIRGPGHHHRAAAPRGSSSGGFSASHLADHHSGLGRRDFADCPDYFEAPVGHAVCRKIGVDKLLAVVDTGEAIPPQRSPMSTHSAKWSITSASRRRFSANGPQRLRRAHHLWR